MGKRYVVIGPRRVCETDPGHEFVRDLTEAEEKTLLGVHVRLVDPTPPPPKPKRAASKRRVNPQPKSEE